MLRRLGWAAAGATLLASGMAIGSSVPPASVPPAAAGVTASLVWSRQFPAVTFRESSPTSANLTTPAYVVGALDGKVYAFDAVTGETEPGWPVATTDPINSSPAAADVVGDGHDRVFVGSGVAATSVAGACSGGGTYAFEPGGTVRWHNVGSDTDCSNQPFQSSFTLGATTGGTQLNATIGALGLQSPSYNATSGVMKPGWPFFTDDTVFSSPAQADVNGDGVPDIIMGGDATPGPNSFKGGMMRAISGSGALLWQYDVDEQVRSSPAVGVIDGSGKPSIVFGTGDFWLTNGGATDSTYLFALNLNGTLKWKENLGGVTQGSPALADVDGNGTADVVEGTSGTPSSPNTGKIWVFNGSGAALPQWAGVTSPGGVIIGGIATADLNGDGAQDLLVPTGAGIFFMDGKTGAQIGGIDTGTTGFQNTPLVTDDGAGNLGITVAGTRPDGTGVVEHWRVSGAKLGSLGWPMFHHDPRHTGNLGSVVSMVCKAAAAAPAPTGKVTRIFGANRDATSVAVSKASFATPLSAKAVVLASDANYPDALAGAPLAAAKGGPLMITAPAGLNGAVKTEIQRVLPPGGTVYVLGGSLALSPAIDAALTGYTVKRLDGPDRFATAVAIANALGSPSTVFEVTGLNFADALAAGAGAGKVGGAILLTNGANQHPTTAAYLAAHQGTRYAIGGPAGSADPSATVLSGADRYQTAVAVAKKFFANPAALTFASGATFADALAGGPAAAAASAPMLLVPACGTVSPAVTGYVTSVATGVQGGVLFGGPLAVGDDVLRQLDAVA